LKICQTRRDDEGHPAGVTTRTGYHFHPATKSNKLPCIAFKEKRRGKKLQTTVRHSKSQTSNFDKNRRVFEDKFMFKETFLKEANKSTA